MNSPKTLFTFIFALAFVQDVSYGIDCQNDFSVATFISIDISGSCFTNANYQAIASTSSLNIEGISIQGDATLEGAQVF